MAHYYAIDEVQEVADYIGDSFYLATLGNSLPNKTIVLCGVDFMAESAKILSPDKTVLIPDITATCPMALMADVAGIEKVRAENDDVAVVCYVNSTAELKAHADVCVTSSNAVKIVSQLPNQNIYFIPDMNLARYIQGKLPEKRFIFNDGFCCVHDGISEAQTLQAKAAHPGVKMLAHPECREETLKHADFIGSTSQILDYAIDSPDEAFIIATEIGILFRLAQKCPEKTFYTVNDTQFCKSMKKNTVEKIIKALETGTPEMTLEDGFLKAAETPLIRMVELAGENKTTNPYDVIIAGIGVSGCYAALNLPEDTRILALCKTSLEESDSFLAQGGICVQKDDDDFDSFFEDTMRAGHYENNPDAVRAMISSSRDVIADLVRLGVEFERDDDGQYLYAREGAHTTNRILYHGDKTGKAITKVLLNAVLQKPNVTILAETTMTDLILENGALRGIKATLQNGEAAEFFAPDVILATGGIGGKYEHSTNFASLTGDSVDVAQKHGIKVINPDFVQIHPTTFYSEEPGIRFLISESVRGEGAVLLGKNGERFADELLPRDKLTEKIREQMAKEGSKYVRLSFATIEGVDLKERFPTIYAHCLEKGYDITKEPIPVVPAQHYYMGGIAVDLDGKTDLSHLYAIGEVSCSGVHGANRLASNSLLESLVFAKRAARAIAKDKG
jgi:L-aspartate oxidase